jgi:hypothetical protein
MNLKFKTILTANLLNYKNGRSQTNYVGNVADIVQAGQNPESHSNYCIFLPYFGEVYLFRHFLLFII